MVAQANSEKKGAFKKIRSFFKGVKAELKKVSWPTRKELTNFTIVVLVTCGIMALLISGLDLGVTEAFKALFKLI